MAKKKAQIEEPIIEEVIEETIAEEVVEETIEAPIEVAQEEVATNNSDQFIFAQMKMINRLNNPAKAKRLAARVLRNRKR